MVAGYSCGSHFDRTYLRIEMVSSSFNPSLLPSRQSLLIGQSFDPANTRRFISFEVEDDNQDKI